MLSEAPNHLLPTWTQNLITRKLCELFVPFLAIDGNYNSPRVGKETTGQLLWQFLSESLGIVNNVVVEES